MPHDADLSLESAAIRIAGFLAELDLRDVTLVCNDWGGAQLVVSPGRSDRVASLVLVSCEAFDNYPPGLPGRLLCLGAALPGGTFMSIQLLRASRIRHLPFTFGSMSKKRVPNDLFMSWIHPARHNSKVDLHDGTARMYSNPNATNKITDYCFDSMFDFGEAEVHHDDFAHDHY